MTKIRGFVDSKVRKKKGYFRFQLSFGHLFSHFVTWQFFIKMLEGKLWDAGGNFKVLFCVSVAM